MFKNSDDTCPSPVGRKHNSLRHIESRGNNNRRARTSNCTDALRRHGKKVRHKSKAPASHTSQWQIETAPIAPGTVDQWTDDGFDEHLATFAFEESNEGTAIMDDRDSAKTLYSAYDFNNELYTWAFGNNANSKFTIAKENHQRMSAATMSGLIEELDSTLTNDFIVLHKRREEYLELRSNFNLQYVSVQVWLIQVTQDFQRMGLDLNLIDFLFIPIGEISTILNQTPSSIINFTCISQYNQKEVVIKLLMELRQKVFQQSRDWIQKSRFILENIWRLNVYVSMFLINRIIELS